MTESTILIVIVVAIVLFLLFIKGVIKTFKRNAIVAALILIFLTPVFLVWAFAELFTGPIEE